MSSVMAVQKELTGIPEFGEEDTALFAAGEKSNCLIWKK